MNMSDVVPESLKDEFTQDEWNNLTDAERDGIVEDATDDGSSETEEQRLQREEEERAREEAAKAAANPEKTDEEREAEAAAAANATDDGKTEEQRQQEAAQQQQQEQQAAIVPQPQGVLKGELPADYDDKVKANAEARKELRRKYNDGDISFDEYEEQAEELAEQRQELRDLKFKAELATESQRQAIVNNWIAVINPFTAAHPELSEDDVARNAFDHYCQQETGKTLQAGGQPGQAEIDRAYAAWCKRFNFTPAGGQRQQEQQQEAQKNRKVPPALGGLPSSATNEVQDGKLAAISRLTGVAYEEALAKLTPAELEQLSMYG
jgi:hypothetical protein